MSNASATIIAALIGFLGGLVVAALTFRQKADELFLAGLKYLEGGSQKRNLGLAALELSWESKRHRRVIANLLIGVALYLLLESKQKDAAHELENLRRIMDLLTSKAGLSSLESGQKERLLAALRKKYQETEEYSRNQGLWVSMEELQKWRTLMK